MGTEEAAAARFPARELAGGGGDAGKRERGPRATPWWVESGSGWLVEGQPRQTGSGGAAVAGGGAPAVRGGGERVWELHGGE